MVDKPSKPRQRDEPEANNEQYEFNLGLYRIETLSEILKVCAKKYRTAIVERDAESVEDYQAMVNVLYTETFIYMKEETDFEIKDVKQNKEDIFEMVLDDFGDLSGQQEIMERLKQTRRVYLEIRNLLQTVGIDIPKKEKIGEMDAFAKG